MKADRLASKERGVADESVAAGEDREQLYSVGRILAVSDGVFAFALTVAFLPFPTAVLGHNGSDSIAPVTYAVTIAVLGISQSALWAYATHGRRLTKANLARRVVHDRFIHSLTVPAVFLLSIPVALRWPTAEEILWSALWIAYFVILRRYVDRITRKL